MALGVSRLDKDTAGGLLVAPTGAPTVKTNGFITAILGDSVAPHGAGPHAAATMVEASLTVFAEGVRVVREGDKASCGDAATGSPNVLAG